MRIKGQTYNFESFTQLSRPSSSEAFQQQINKLQENLEHCRREISNFDVYHIAYAVTDLADLNSIKNKLVPGEALVIAAPSNDEYKTGQLIIKLSPTEFLEDLRPFQTGTYFPQTITKIGDSTYTLSFGFVDKTPIAGVQTINDTPYTGPLKTNLQANLGIKTTDSYYYGFDWADEASTSQENTVTFFKELQQDKPIYFTPKQTRPILKFFKQFNDNDGVSYEEINIDYSLVKVHKPISQGSSTEVELYELSVDLGGATKLFVAIK